MKFHTIDLEFLGATDTVAVFLIETSVGPVLIETGPHSTLPVLNRALDKIGYKIEDIKHVFLTHIHLDHAGSAWVFAKNDANIFVHPLGVKHLADPSRLMASAKMIYQDRMDELWGDMQAIDNQKLISIGNGQNLMIGDTKFTAWHTPGHAVHHISWQVDDVLFTGDSAGVCINAGPVVAPCPPPDINVEHWLTSIALMRNLDVSQLQLTHYGTVADIQKHFDELENIIHDWANWMKPYFENQTPQAEITPIFQAYVGAQLRAKDLSESEIIKYEYSNPSWMSVAGLMRYWGKVLG
jgi:glyoxylase-like metal-dependent hydrolase (beta-lactamase superfamily II)